MSRNYPVQLSEYSEEEAPYVYTQKAEAHAKERGLEPRTAGTIAMFAGEPLTGDDENVCTLACAWRRHGYIVRRGEYQNVD